MAQRHAALLVVPFALSACMEGYQPDHLLGETHSALRFECLDVALLAVVSEVARTNVEVDLGNRCHDPVPVDLSRIRAWATDRDGTEHALTMYDPRAEVGPRLLEGRGEAREKFRFVPSVAFRGVRRVCFDLAAIARGAGGARELCFERGGG